jgi:sarcosine oxidase/L-pipecolate oxidase
MVTNLITYLDSHAYNMFTRIGRLHLLRSVTQAFDKVPHNLLLNKLESFGMSPGCVTWFHSYISSRSTSVCILEKFSSPFYMFSDLPQGSILDPFCLTFLLTIYMSKVIILFLISY